MITYVNTVFVSNGNGTIATSMPEVANIKKGQFILLDVDADTFDITATTSRFKIGMFTGKTAQDHKGVKHPEIKWSNIINVADIKSISTLAYESDSEDVVEIDFNKVKPAVIAKYAEGGKRIITRLTFKDLPTRFRNWTESYEYVTQPGDTATTIAEGIANLITKEWKRARVEAEAVAGKLTITALPYDDDDAVDTLNWAAKVRFNANVYWTDPAGEGWESLNKHYPNGLEITKTPGSQYPASAKLVRDREAQGMGYLGILNRGEGTWPIVKPAMETNLENQYNAFLIEFENMYRTADDLFRKTKQTVEIYTVGDTDIFVNKIKLAQDGAVSGKNVDTTTETTEVKKPRTTSGD